MIVIIVVGASTAAHAREGLTLDPDTYFAMDNATADAYIKDSLGVEQNSTAAALVRENQVMNDETVEWIKEYLISAIRNNMNTMTITIDQFGGMEVSNQDVPADSWDDEIMVTIPMTPFSIADGYEFQLGKIIAPNGTQVLPR